MMLLAIKQRTADDNSPATGVPLAAVNWPFIPCHVRRVIAQYAVRMQAYNVYPFLVAPLACCAARLNQSGCRLRVCVCVCVYVWKFFSDQPLSPSWFDRCR